MTDSDSFSKEHPPSLLQSKSKRMAVDRWKILRDKVLSCKSEEESGLRSYSTSSVRSFSSFGLFTVTKRSVLVKSTRCDDTELWVHYRPSDDKITKSGFQKVVVKLISEKLTLETLMGFNNTGNICVWPAEEVMAYYCLKNFEMFKDTTVCEIGGGMTSLSGLMLASTRLPSKVLLTDGNQRSVDNIKEIISANECLTGFDASSEVIMWDQSFLGKHSVHDSSFDYVLCADCLFFKSVHSQLVKVIFKLLRLHGEALIFAPRRSGSLEQFCCIASEYFDLQTITKYDDIVWLKHETFLRDDGNYKSDLHYPVMILLKKIQ